MFKTLAFGELFMLSLLVLGVIALIDILKAQFNGYDKLIWVLVVILLPVVGAILYFLIGKKQKLQ